MDTEGDFSESNQPGDEADHSPPSSSKVKNGGDTHPLTNMFSWRDVYLFDFRDNFISHVNILFCGRKWSWPNLRDNTGSQDSQYPG
jgi:hypothetical protein